MTTVAPRRSLGSISWRERRSAYEIRVRERPGDPPTSSYVTGPDTPERRRLAEQELADRLAKVGRGERSYGRRLTVDRFLDEWCELHVGLKSYRDYRTRVDLYLRPELGRIRLAELEPIDVQRAMARLARRKSERTGRVLSAGTVYAAYRVLSAALQSAWEQGKAPRNAARYVTVARPDTRIEPPTLEELDRLFAVLAADPWHAVFAVMRWTGARESEALGLEWRYIDLEAGTLTFVRQASGRLKTRKSVRTVAPPRFVVEELARIPRRIDSPLVFTTSTGRRIDQRNLLRHFDAAAARAGIAPDPAADLDKYRPHDLRHAFATMLLEAGATPQTVAAWLGHSSLAMLERYSHVHPIVGGAAQRRVIEAWGADAGMILRRLAVGA